MNILTLNWIKFFRSVQFQPEIIQKTFEYISELSPNTFITIESISRHTLTTSNEAIKLLRILTEANLLKISSRCPECGKKINISTELIIECKYCETDINIVTLPVALINSEASLVHLFKDKIDDNRYETNASIVSSKIKGSEYLYYLITDIENSQTQQKLEPNKYLSVLDQLWTNLWPKVMRSTKKASLPLLSRGDSVSWIFTDKEDIFNCIEEIVVFLCKNQIAKLTIYGSDVCIASTIREPFMRSLDRKWDLNTPTITDLYRKTNFIPTVWKKSTDHVVKYCLFDGLTKIPDSNTFSFLRNGVINKYNVIDKHKNHYDGKCYAGYCNAKTIINQEPPHA